MNRVNCTICGSSILEDTARRHKGFCAACAAGRRPCISCGTRVYHPYRDGRFICDSCAFSEQFANLPTSTKPSLTPLTSGSASTVLANKQSVQSLTDESDTRKKPWLTQVLLRLRSAIIAVLEAPMEFLKSADQEVEKRSHAQIAVAATVPAFIGWILFVGFMFFDWDIHGWLMKTLFFAYFICAFYSAMLLARLEETIEKLFPNASPQKRDLILKVVVGFNIPVLFTAMCGAFGGG